MRKKIFLVLVILIIAFLPLFVTAEELIVSTSYPSPWAAYKQLLVAGEYGVSPNQTAVLFNGENTLVLMNIGVPSNDPHSGYNHIPALLQVGGIAEVPSTETPPPNINRVAIVAVEDVGICGISIENAGVGIVGFAMGLPVMGEYAIGIKGDSENGIGVRGEGVRYGVYGRLASPLVSSLLIDGSAGVFGEANVVTDKITYGVHGLNSSERNESCGVYGNATATAGNTYGVYGESSSDNIFAAGIYGHATNCIGIYGESDNRIGIYAKSKNVGGLRKEANLGIGGSVILSDFFSFFVSISFLLKISD